MTTDERECYDEERGGRENDRPWSHGSYGGQIALVFSIAGLFGSQVLQLLSLHDFSLLTMCLSAIGLIKGVMSLGTSPGIFSWLAIAVGLYGTKDLLLLVLFVFIAGAGGPGG